MKNYAGHRLSPWLGHLMVSRSETARQLLTPGEVMQLPPDDEIVMVAGVQPIRAKKVRYFKDRRFTERVHVAARPQRRTNRRGPTTGAASPLARRPPPNAAAGPGARGRSEEDAANAGCAASPSLDRHIDIAPEPTARARQGVRAGRDRTPRRRGAAGGGASPDAGRRRGRRRSIPATASSYERPRRPLSVYLDPELMHVARGLCDRRGKSRSLIAEAAIASFLSPDADEQREAAIRQAARPA